MKIEKVKVAENDIVSCITHETNQTDGSRRKKTHTRAKKYEKKGKEKT